jgi:cytochrome b6-f complex iron-sulfur subunit
MSGECTHLTCPVQKKDVEKGAPGDDAPLRCPCHGGVFSRTGEVLDGPPPRPLRRLAIELPADGVGMIHLLEV